MGTKPVNFTAKTAKDATKKLNELVDQGIYGYEKVGIVTEYVKTISKNYDGSTSETKEPVWRFVGLAEAVEDNELADFTNWKKENDDAKKEREELDRSLHLLNGKAFGPLSIFLTIAGAIMFILGILTLTKVLPLPEEQIVIAVILTIVGALAIAGAIVACIFRGKKINKLQSDRSSIEEKDAKLKEKELKLKGDEPIWHAEGMFQYKDRMVWNTRTKYELIVK